MDAKPSKDSSSSAPTDPSVSSVTKGTGHEVDLPKIKTEPLEDPPLATSPDEEFTDEEDDGLAVDEDGVEYYVDDDFRIKQVATPLIINRKMKDLYILSMGKLLNLETEYQRDVVWDEMRSSGLIQSLLQGYFIPPIVFNLITTMEYPDGGGRNKVKRVCRRCVDGKQRLTSMIKFMSGEIGVWDSMNPPKKWFFTHQIVNGIEQTSARLILPEKTKDFFRQRTFCCYEYNELPESIEENMFQLVQRGMPLTPAEKMRALSTRWAVFAKQYEEDYSMVVNLSKQARASGFRAVVTILSQICEVMSRADNQKTNKETIGQMPNLQASPQALMNLLNDNKAPGEAQKAKFKEVFDKFQELVDLSSRKSHSAKFGYKITPNSAFDPAPDYLRERSVAHVKTFSPLELLATGILVLVHGDSRSAEILIGDIKEMRRVLRRAHKDLRLNPACWSTVWKFIDTDIIRTRGGGASLTNGGDHKGQEDSEDVVELVLATQVNGIDTLASENPISLPKVVGMGLSKDENQPTTSDRKSSAAKSNYTPEDSKVQAELADNHRFDETYKPPETPAATGSEDSGVFPGTVPDVKGRPKSRLVQIATFSDESEDEKKNLFSANKKRKIF